MRATHRIIRLSLCLAVVMLLSACTKPAAQAMLEDYATRVARVLDMHIEMDLAAAAMTLKPFPAKRERWVLTETLREGLLDVLDFKQCGVLQLIAERNSSLGKVMPPSQKMRYEINLLAAIQRCQQQLYAQTERDTQQQGLLQRLDAIHTLKQAQLAAEIWNGLYVSEEMEAHFALGKPPLPLPDTGKGAGFGPLRQALSQLQTLAYLAETTATGEPITAPAWLDEIEDIYFTLYSSEFGAQVLTSFAMLTTTLNTTAQLIEKRLEQGPFCRQGIKNRQAEILFNVFRLYYAGQLQPYMTLLHREGQAWLTWHEQVLRALPVPEAMRTYQQQMISLSSPQGLWQQWQQANQRHTQAWQHILGQCGLMPTAPL